MSEYQYYEFRTDGRKLDREARSTLEDLSSRAIVTTTQAIYTYSYGDFRYDEKEILADYFDMLLYMNSFGTRQLMLRLPVDWIEHSKINPYCVSNVISYSIHGESLILDLCIYDEEGGGWIEGDGVLDDLAPIRQQLLNGDLSALYIAWLAAAQYYHVDEEGVEPPVPDNLKQLSPELEALISYFELDMDLVQVAAETSKSVDIQESEMNILISQLSEEEKNTFLVGFMQNMPDLSFKLKRRLQDFINYPEQEDFNSARTFAQLRNQSEEITKLREEKIENEKRSARVKELQRLAINEPAIWQEVNNSIQSKTQSGYRHATKLLGDLRELAIYANKTDQFESKMIEIRKEFSRLSSFMRGLYECELA
ncbi:hypothetical protein [Legionella waltersii]|uniref:Uncharacterized protein n=1 Tax=Legionella waltersii TaxID=66969 RepID=A0A0W1A217_9GAMM|nr:hypothetical protein [Legionella waltersii]KTD75184.1 hypothetical protein Lwal_3225 [Legionella waltersii]SNV10348.1 Uncharacterised protein [Legionella waltersii]